MNKLNIERLHKLFLTDSLNKGCGKTTGVIHQAIGFSQVMNHTDIIIFVNKKLDIESVSFELEKWLASDIFSIKNIFPEVIYEVFNTNKIIITSIHHFLYSTYNWDTYRNVLILFDFGECTSINYSSESLQKTIHYMIYKDCNNVMINEFNS